MEEQTMRVAKSGVVTFGDLVVAVTDEVAPLVRSKKKTTLMLSCILQDLFATFRVRFANKSLRSERNNRPKRNSGLQPRWPAVALGVLLFMNPGSLFAGAAEDQLKQSVEKIQSILSDPAFKGDAKATARREKLKEAISERFDFEEMARRSLGAQWQKRTPEEQKEFVQLFRDLLEGAYLGKLEEYSGEKVRYLSDREEKDLAEINTKVVNKKGEEFALDYRLRNANGDWKVIDVVVENISLVNNYRSQFNRILTKSSFQDLVQAMKQKKLSAPAANG